MELTVVMPCLNEAETVATCVRKAMGFLAESGISGEVLVADNGSTDGSQQLAADAGARVVPISDKGYGNALMGGIAPGAIPPWNRLPITRSAPVRSSATNGIRRVKS